MARSCLLLLGFFLSWRTSKHHSQPLTGLWRASSPGAEQPGPTCLPALCPAPTALPRARRAVRKENNGSRGRRIEWQREEMTETQEAGREVFLHKQAREERAGQTKVNRRKPPLFPGEHVVRAGASGGSSGGAGPGALWRFAGRDFASS